MAKRLFIVFVGVVMVALIIWLISADSNKATRGFDSYRDSDIQSNLDTSQSKHNGSLSKPHSGNLAFPSRSNKGASITQDYDKSMSRRSQPGLNEKATTSSPGAADLKAKRSESVHQMSTKREFKDIQMEEYIEKSHRLLDKINQNYDRILKHKKERTR